ncbi:MAG: hypothetical protein JXB85_16300 [Anaerolineales bacterium]|nr:hypothetical protein [Anaerolineales bacterium]
MTDVWDDERVKALLHFPRFPIRLIQQEPWQSWIREHGGLKAVHDYLQHYPFPPSHRRILEAVLSTPEAVANVYADRLNISRATYFYQLRELVAAIVQALNQWEPTEALLSREATFPRSSLPAPLTSLVGVEAVLRALARLLASPDVRLLTLLGPGGIGKTRLSIALAHRQNRPACFVDISAHQDPAKVPAVIAKNLGVKTATASGLKNALREHEFLLILDNFEQILPARSLVTDLLTACPRLKILVTSRAALHVYGEHAFIVPPLATADVDTVKDQQLWAQSPGVTLFVQRAQAVNPNFSLNKENVESVTEICQRLEGLPLAIELAAFQVKFFSPQAILMRLSDHLLNFLGQGVNQMPARQQGIRAMLDWSFKLLPPELQAFFCQLSVFPGSFTIAEAETLCAVEEVQGGLTTLVDHSMIDQHIGEDGEPCFQMLDMIREYARERCRCNLPLDKKAVRHDNLLNAQSGSNL